MPRRMNLVGQKFNMLTVLEFYDVQNGQSRWLCKCDCGNITVVYGRNLKIGNTMSCGCYHKNHNKEFNYKHGDSKNRLYSIWSSMKSRCFDKKKKEYYWYGAKGITVCDEWLSYENFKKWALLNGYKENLTIDRIDSNKNYCPENCQWISLKENTDKSRRKYSGIAVNEQGKIEKFNNLAEFARIHNMIPHSVQSAAKAGRLFKGWKFILD